MVLAVDCGLLGCDAVWSSYKTTRCRNPEDHDHHLHRCENLVSQVICYVFLPRLEIKHIIINAQWLYIDTV